MFDADKADPFLLRETNAEVVWVIAQTADFFDPRLISTRFETVCGLRHTVSKYPSPAGRTGQTVVMGMLPGIVGVA